MSLLNEIEDVVESMLLNEVTNEEIIKKFLTNNFAHNKDEAPKYGVRTDTWNPIWGTANLKITRIPLDLEQEVKGWALNNNATPMIYMDNDGGIYFNTEKMSTSTTKIQTIVKGFLETEPELKDKVREVDGKTINKLLKGEKVEQDLLKKIGEELPEPEETEIKPEEEIPSEEVPEEIPEEEVSEEIPEMPEEEAPEEKKKKK